MVRRRTRKGILALGAVCLGLGLAPGGARAQLFGGPQTPPSGGAALVGAAPTAATGMGAGMMYGNPYMNPLMNPYMNPYLTQVPGAQGNPALYLFAAQQMNGGVLSGRIGGPKAAGATAAKPGAVSTPAAVADAMRPTGANTPGAMASRYFNRSTPTNPGTARYYGRQSKHYPNNGR